MKLGTSVSLLQEASDTICKSPVLPEILGNIVDIALKSLLADLGGVILLSQESGFSFVGALRGFTPEEVEAFEKSPPGLLESLRRERISPRLKNYLVAPAKNSNKQFGILFVGRVSQEIFTREDQEFLETLAHQVALAGENMKLHMAIQHFGRREERRRIALDLHNGIAQSLFGMVLLSRSCQKLFYSDAEAVRRKLSELERLGSQSLNGVRQRYPIVPENY